MLRRDAVQRIKTDGPPRCEFELRSHLRTPKDIIESNAGIKKSSIQRPSGDEGEHKAAPNTIELNVEHNSQKGYAASE